MDFDEFYGANFVRVQQAMTLSFRDSAFAEEITQEAFYRALRRWRSVSVLDHPEAWILVTALNCGRDLARKRRMHADRDPSFARAESSESTEGNVDDRMVIVELLSKVSARQREALILRYIAQLTVPEIASVMGCAEGTVKSTLHAAMSVAVRNSKGTQRVAD
jgi:RNA polymerase sigma-70 factor (ECF subfamily)